MRVRWIVRAPVWLYRARLGVVFAVQAGHPRKAFAMIIGVLAAVLGLLLATAAIVIPRMVGRHNKPEDDAASRAYLASTGRTAEEVTQANRGGKTRPDSDAQPGQADGAGR